MSGSSFSLLREWITSPRVVGTFSILGIGFLVVGLFAVASYLFDENGCIAWSMFFGIGSAFLFVAVIVCAVAFNDWARSAV